MKNNKLCSYVIKHFIIQLMCNIKYVDTIKIIKYLKVLQHVSVGVMAACMLP